MSFYESLINSLDQGIILFDIHERIVFVNKTAEEILFKSFNEIQGKLFNEIYKDENVISPLIKKVIHDNRSFSGYYETIRLDKEMKLDFFLSPFFQGKIEGVVLSIKKSGNIPLNDDTNFDSLIHILSNIAHEIKNPLTGIKASAQLMKPQVTSTLKDYVNRIIKESDRLDRVLHDYLTISKKPVFNIINLHEIIEVALKILDIQIKKKNIQIKRVYDTSLPTIRGDEGKLLQVFLNIIGNAIDSVKQNGTIMLRSHPSNEYLLKKGQLMHWAIVDIQDNGIGIHARDLKKIFTPFYTSKKNGTGLGLAISKKIISDHKGLIQVKSTERKGTVFSIYMPLK